MMSASFPDSSSIAAAAYEPTSARLRIVFRDGSCYDYLDVPSNIFSQLGQLKITGRILQRLYPRCLPGYSIRLRYAYLSGIGLQPRSSHYSNAIA